MQRAVPRLCSCPAPTRTLHPLSPAHLLDGLLSDLSFASRPRRREGHGHGGGADSARDHWGLFSGCAPRPEVPILRSAGGGGAGGAVPWARPPACRQCALEPPASPRLTRLPPGTRSRAEPPCTRPALCVQPVAATPPPVLSFGGSARPAPPRRAARPPDAGRRRRQQRGRGGRGADGECALLSGGGPSSRVRSDELRPRHHRLLARRPPLPSGVRAGGGQEGLHRGEPAGGLRGGVHKEAGHPDLGAEAALSAGGGWPGR